MPQLMSSVHAAAVHCAAGQEVAVSAWRLIMRPTCMMVLGPDTCVLMSQAAAVWHLVGQGMPTSLSARWMALCCCCCHLAASLNPVSRIQQACRYVLLSLSRLVTSQLPRAMLVGMPEVCCVACIILTYHVWSLHTCTANCFRNYCADATLVAQVEPLADWHVGAITGVAATATGAHLVSCGLDGSIRVWAAATGGQLVSKRDVGGQLTCSVACMGPDSSLLAVGSKVGVLR